MSLDLSIISLIFADWVVVDKICALSIHPACVVCWYQFVEARMSSGWSLPGLESLNEQSHIFSQLEKESCN